MDETPGNILIELVEGGFIGQAILATLIGGAILWQVIHNQPLDDFLKQSLAILLGYYFHMGVTAASKIVFHK